MTTHCSDEPREHKLARLLAVASPGAGDWLKALPAASLGLKLDNQKFRICVALRLGEKCCQPHSCRLCGSLVTNRGIHGLCCKRSVGRHSRHQEDNMIICRALQSARVSSILEPAGLCRNDDKRPDGLTLTPW